MFLHMVQSWTEYIAKARLGGRDKIEDYLVKLVEPCSNDFNPLQQPKEWHSGAMVIEEGDFTYQ